MSVINYKTGLETSSFENSHENLGSSPRIGIDFWDLFLMNLDFLVFVAGETHSIAEFYKTDLDTCICE